MYPRLTLTLPALFLTVAPPALAAFTCPPMPVAVTTVNTDIKSDISASVGSLGKIKVGEIASKTEIEAKNLFAKYPNVDKLLALQTMSATYCDMLKNTTAIPEIEKIDRWERFQDKVLDLRSTPTAPKPQGKQTQPSTNSALPSKPAPQAARIQLGKLGLPYEPRAFVGSAEAGDLAAVALFLAAGMDPNATTGSSPNSTSDRGQTALMAAASKGHTKVVAALVEAGADVNKTNSIFTPLTLAAAAGHIDVLRILLNKPVDAEAINRAFVNAAGSRRREVVRVLLDRGADIRKAGPSAMVFLLSRGGGSVNREGEGDAEVSEVLKTVLDSGADPNGRDQNGWSPLLAAAKGRFPTAIRLLLERGADVNVKCDCPNSGYGGATALMLAVRARAPESVEVLLGKGAEVNQADDRGETALTLARSNGGGDENARRIDQLLSKPTTQ